MIGQGDFLQLQVNYTEGALRYVFQTPNSNWGKMDGASAGWALLTDAVYGGTIAAGTASGLARPRPGTSTPPTITSGTCAGGRRCMAAMPQSATISRPTRTLRLRHRADHQRLRHELANVVARFAHPAERYQGLLHGRGRTVLEAANSERRRRAIGACCCGNCGEYDSASSGRRQLAIPLPRASRLLSLIA